MNTFSKETLLVAKNWDTVEEILKAKEQLENQFSNLLRSIESELARQDWWPDGWVFVPNSRDQAYISKQQWQVSDTFIIWIGVENFAPASIFGLGAAPRLYIWIPTEHRSLASSLVRELEKNEEALLGEIDHRTTNGYVIKHEVMKCPPEAAETFGPEAKQQIIDFFAHYARMSSFFEPVIQIYLEKREAK